MSKCCAAAVRFAGCICSLAKQPAASRAKSPTLFCKLPLYCYMSWCLSQAPIHQIAGPFPQSCRRPHIPFRQLAEITFRACTAPACLVISAKAIGAVAKNLLSGWETCWLDSLRSSRFIVLLEALPGLCKVGLTCICGPRSNMQWQWRSLSGRPFTQMLYTHSAKH